MDTRRAILPILALGLAGYFLYRAADRHSAEGRPAPGRSASQADFAAEVRDASDESAEPNLSDSEEALRAKLTNVSLYSGYLAGTGNSAAGWAAVADITEDEGVLLEALRKFPDDSGLLMRAAWCLSDPTLALQYGERLRELLSESSAADYIVASLLLQKGTDRERAKAILSEALSKAPPDLADEGSFADRREALSSIGFPDDEARIRSLVGPLAGADPGFKLGAAAKAVIAGNDQEMMETYVAVSQHFLLNENLPLHPEIMILDIQRKLLLHLPETLEFGESGLTLAERHDEVREQLLGISREMVDFSTYFWDNATPSERIVFADNVIAKGERAARQDAIEKGKRMHQGANLQGQ